jgi:hypothetical protein
LASAGSALADEAQAASSDVPGWTLHARGGAFYPAIDNWDKYYDTNYMGYFALSGDWWVNRYFGVGAELAYMRDEGKGELPVQGGTGGSVEYRLWPLSLFVSTRGAFRDDQVIIPYLNAGYTYLTYEQKVIGQDKSRGSTGGFIAHLGVQFLLDPLDTQSAQSLESTTGIQHTYFELDLMYLKADTKDAFRDSVDLGGLGFSLGVCFEF